MSDITIETSASLAAGLLLVRLALGLAMAAHGTQKLFGWFGGHGIEGTAKMFAGLGLRPGPLMALAAGVAELTGGLLLALGFLGPIGPALVLGVVTVAALAVHRPHGFFAMNNGVELPVVYAAAGSALAFTSFGRFSFDRMLGLSWVGDPRVVWGVLLLALALAFLVLTIRRAAVAADARSHAEPRPQRRAA